MNAPHSTGHRTYADSSMHVERVPPWTVKQSILYLDVTIGAQWAVDSAIGTGFYKLLSVFAKLYPPHMPQFYMPTIGNHRNNSKITPISHYLVPTSTGPAGKALALVASYAIFSAVDTCHRDTGYSVCSTSYPSLVSLCSPIGLVIALWAVNGSRRFRDCQTLPTLHILT